MSAWTRWSRDILCELVARAGKAAQRASRRRHGPIWRSLEKREGSILTVRDTRTTRTASQSPVNARVDIKSREKNSTDCATRCVRLWAEGRNAGHVVSNCHRCRSSAVAVRLFSNGGEQDAASCGPIRVAVQPHPDWRQSSLQSQRRHGLLG